MKLDRLPEYVTTVVVIGIGMAFATAAGRMAGSGQMNLILLILTAIAVITFAMSFRQSIWLLIPAGWVFEGQLTFLPLPFALRDLIIMTIFASFCAFIALRIVKVRPTFGFLDFLVFLNLAYLLSVFLRNPVGVEAFGSARVGGRPYVTVFVGFLGYLVLRSITPTRKELMLFPWIVTGANIFIGLLNLVAYFVPWTAPLMGKFYTGINQEGYEQTNVTVGGDDKQRLNQLSNLGSITANLLCSIYRPITLLLPWFPGRFAAFMISMSAVAFSGHRSALLYVMLFFAVASYYRKRLRDTIQIAMVGIALIGILIFIQGRLVNLPFAVQRTLSWLPGEWSYTVRADARDSTEWRIGMWKIALTDPTYIDNKIFGDGFGFTQWELAIIYAAESAKLMGVQTELTSQDVALRMGSFHSGPVSTLKIVGVVGSILFYTLFIGVAIYAHRLVLRARGTPYFNVALFLCVPNVYFPFVFIFIFGGFDPSFAAMMATVGLLQAFDRALVQVEKQDAAPPQRRSRDRRRRLVLTDSPEAVQV